MEQAADILVKIIHKDFASSADEGLRLLQRAVKAGHECLETEGNLFEKRRQLCEFLFDVKQFYGENDSAKAPLFDMFGRALGYEGKTRQDRKNFHQRISRRPPKKKPATSSAYKGLLAVQQHYADLQRKLEQQQMDQEEMEMQEEEQQETLDNLQAQADGERRSSRNVSRVDYTEGGSRGQGGQASRGKGGSSRKKGGKGRGGKKKPASGGQGSTKKKTGRGV